MAGVIPLVAVSGQECVDALVQAGYRARSADEHGTTLVRGERVVVVPDAPMLTPETLEALLRDAGLPYGEFLDLLCECPTDPALVASHRRPSARAS